MNRKKKKKTPLPDIRLARKRHMPNRNEKREHSP